MNPTDPLLRNEFPDDERSVRALAEAFRIRADTFEPAPLPDFAGPVPGRRQAPWRAMAVAAAVALIAGAAAYGVTRGGDTPPPPPTKQSDNPTVTKGWHWESTRDLAVQVPDTWGYAPVLGGGSFCRPGGQQPFVDLFATTAVERGIDCFGEEITEISPEGIAESHWSTHLVLGPKPAADTDFQADGTYTQGRWTKVVRTIGSGQVTLLYDTNHAVEARKVLESAEQLGDRDPLGCDVSSPIQSSTWVRPDPVDLPGLRDVTGMTVCQYDTTAAPGAPGLLASHPVDGGKARAFIDALGLAPAGPPVEDSCVGAPASEAIVLRISAADGTHDVHFGYLYCQGGFDDGTTVHSMSAESCHGLFAGRVFWAGGTEAQATMCR
jgi:hypothetical protein